MSRLSAPILCAALAWSSVSVAQPPVRKYDDKGAPPFKVLKEGENPPLDAYDNFVIGPKYVPAPERKKVEGVPEGTVQQFVIDSKETKLFNPGIARKEFGKVDPKNPKTLIVETHTINVFHAVASLTTLDKYAGTATVWLPLRIVDDPSERKAFRDRVMGSRLVVNTEQVAQYLALDEAVRNFASSRNMADLVDGKLGPEIAAAIEEGATYIRIGSILFEGVA